MTDENNIHSYQANVAVKATEAAVVSEDGMLLEEISIGTKITDLHDDTGVIVDIAPVKELGHRPAISSIRYDSSQRAKRRKIRQLEKRVAATKGAKKRLFKEMLKILKRHLYKFNNSSLSGAFYGGRGSKTQFRANHKREREYLLYGIPFPKRDAPSDLLLSIDAAKVHASLTARARAMVGFSSVESKDLAEKQREKGRLKILQKWATEARRVSQSGGVIPCKGCAICTKDVTSRSIAESLKDIDVSKAYPDHYKVHERAMTEAEKAQHAEAIKARIHDESVKDMYPGHHQVFEAGTPAPKIVTPGSIDRIRGDDEVDDERFALDA